MLTEDEKVLAHILKDPRVPVGTIEGFYKEERAVFLVLVDQDEKTGKVDLTPVAMMLRDEDIKHVTRPPDEDVDPASQLIIPGRG